MFCKSFNLVKKENIDVIHSVGTIASAMGAILSKIFDKPHIFTVQGGRLGNYTEMNFLAKKGLKFTLANSDLVHCISKSIENGAKEYGAKKTIRIPNGVYIKRSGNANKKTLKAKLCIDTEKVILYAGRLIERKGVRHLIEAMPIVLRCYDDIKLIIIGDGPEKDKLITHTRKLGIEGNVDFSGVMFHERIFSYMEVSDILVCPSIFEPLGIVLIEAMACGIPVIGTNVGGIPDIIENEVNGFLVPPNDSNAIAKAILKILNDEGLALRLSQNGLRIAEKKFNWDKICEKIYNEYTPLINQRQTCL